MIMPKNIVQTIAICITLGFFTTANPQHLAIAGWTSNVRENMAVCTVVGQQSSAQILGDGEGGAIIVWEDARNVHFDIFAQRIDAKGNALWQKDGVPVCIAPENQTKPKIVGDGAGGVIVVWQDIRLGKSNCDVYVQHIDGNGAPLWAENGIRVCSEEHDQNSPCIATDGAGGAIVIWQDFRTNYADLYTQRIDKNGVPLWAENGVLVCGVSGAQSAPVSVYDGVGGVIVAWQDFRKSYADVYAQRIDGSGNRLWEKLGVPLCTAIGHESFIVITGNGAEGAFATWIDTRNGNNDIYAQQVDGNGAVQWQENGISVCALAGNQTYPMIASDGAGGCILAWWDGRSGDLDIYAQRIGPAGDALWARDGLAVCAEQGIQNYVSVAGDGSGGAVMAWNDNRASTFDVYAQRVDRTGLALWPKNGIAASTASGTQCFPILVGDGAGGAIIVWQDDRNKERNYWDIYAQKIGGLGTAGE